MMKRFTNKDRTAGIRLDVEEFDGIDNDIRGSLIGAKMQSALRKLAAFEDLEEELGIGLLTLLKALKQETLFVKTRHGIKETIPNGQGWGLKALGCENGHLVLFADILYPKGPSHEEQLTALRLALSDYGEEWALTKEELE